MDAAAAPADREDPAEQRPLQGLTAFVRGAWPDLRRHRGLGGIVALTVLPEVATATVLPLLLQLLIDHGLLRHDGAMATVAIGSMAGVAVLEAGASLVQKVVGARFAAAVATDLRGRLFERLQTVPIDYHGRAQAADLASRFSADADAVERAIQEDLPYALSLLLTTVVGVAILFTVNAGLAALCTALMPVILIGPRLLGRRPDEAGDLHQNAVGQMLSFVDENLAGQRVVRAFGLRGRELERFAAQQEQLAMTSRRVGLLNGVFTASVSGGSYLVLLVGMAVSAHLVLDGSMTLGSMVAFVDLLWFVSAAVQQISSVVGSFQHAGSGIRRIRQVLDVAPEALPPAEGGAALPEGAVRLEGVVFGHDPRHPVLQGVDLDVAPGGRAALVGASGSGKSTILSVVLRLARPQAGRVLLGGRDLAEVPEAQLRATVGAVFQDNYLFDTSIAENIRLARPGASDDDVRAAAAGAELHELVTAMPEGYDTVVGEGGARLSGGQRQRVAIARLLLRDPRVMVFDEPTSALDAGTEAAITATLSRATRGRTSITVTHRLAVVADADCIHVVDAGRIVESGTHEDLLAAGGAYADLWRKQTGFSLEGGGGAVEPQRLRAVPIFGELGEDALAAAAGLFVRADAAAGRLVIRQGDPGDRFYILVRGQCDVLLDGPPGTEPRVVARLEDGDHFGEVALLGREPRVASVRTRTDSVFLTLHAAQFRQLLDATPGLAERLRHTHERRVAERFSADPQTQEVPPG